MLSYQHGNNFGRYVKEHTAEKNAYVFYHCSNDFSTTFYAQQMPDTTLWNREDFRAFLNSKKSVLAITPQAGIDELKADSIPFEIVQQQNSMRISQLNLKFLNPETRESVCKKMYLVKIRLKV